MKNSGKKLFSEWDKEALEETFGLRCVRAHPVLRAWLASAEPLVIDDSVFMNIKKNTI